MGLWRYYEKGITADTRFYILLAVTIVPLLLLVITFMPKVLVFDDYVFARYAFIYKRYLRSDITYLETVKKVTALRPEHISAYSLIVEEGTPFYDM